MGPAVGEHGLEDGPVATEDRDQVPQRPPGPPDAGQRGPDGAVRQSHLTSDHLTETASHIQSCEEGRILRLKRDTEGAQLVLVDGMYTIRRSF